MKSRITTLFTITIYFFVAQVHAATIKGVAIDKQTKEQLIGATIFIEGTTKSTITNLDGSFTLKNIEPGTYNIACQYLGYNKMVITVTVPDNDAVVNSNFESVQEGVQMQEIEVKGQADRESDETARKSEKNADNVLNIMSAKTIQLLPDITVGNVLQRVSGVSVVRNSSGDGQYAIIRGMDQRYNYTLVNGVKIPSPDNKNRYVPMDIFPADLMERLEVSKSLTPNMEGDAIGGTMNMVMKSAPQHLTVTASAATGINSMFFNRTYNDFDRSETQYKSPRELNGDNYVSKLSDFNVSHARFNEVKIPANLILNFSIGNRILNKRLGIMFGASYQSLYRGTNSTFSNQNPTPTFQPYPNTPTFSAFTNRKYDNYQSRLGFSNKIDFAINEKNKIYLNNVFMNLNDNLHRNSVDLPAAEGYFGETDRSRMVIQTIFNTTLKGDHKIHKGLSFDWSLVYSKAYSNTPDWTEFNVVHSADKTIRVNSLSHLWTYLNDEDKAVYSNLNLNLSKYIGNFNNNLDIDLSVGGLYRSKDRKNFYTKTSLKAVGDNQLFTGIDNAVFAYEDPAHGAEPDTANGYNYAAQENIMAYYFMSKLNLFQKLQIISGVRVEDTEINYQSKLIKTQDGRNGKLPYVDFLPSINLKYSITTKSNFRASYYAAIARQSFIDIIPAQFPDDNYDVRGNYNLKRTTSNNFDLRYEYFPKGIDQLIIGGFYKIITNPIEYAFLQTGNNAQVITPQNFGTATNFGIEFVLTKYFLKNWGVNLNYTFTQSQITQGKKVYQRQPDGSLGEGALENQVRPLQGQSDHIGNISLLYKNSKIGFDAQLSWVYTGQRISFVNTYKDLDWWQRPFHQLDFSAEKRIAKSFTVFTKITNLLNTALVIEIKKPNTIISTLGQDSENSIIVQKDVFNQTLQMGLRYKLQ